MSQPVETQRAIQRFENGRADDSLTLAAFDIRTVDGQAHPFRCTANELPRAAGFLLKLAQFIAQKKGGLKGPSAEQQIQSVPVSAVAVGFGIGPGRSDHEVAISIHIGIDQPIALWVESSILAQLRILLDQALLPLSSPEELN
jgi:hypothetical protein